MDDGTRLEMVAAAIFNEPRRSLFVRGVEDVVMLTGLDVAPVTHAAVQMALGSTVGIEYSAIAELLEERGILGLAINPPPVGPIGARSRPSGLAA